MPIKAEGFWNYSVALDKFIEKLISSFSFMLIILGIGGYFQFLISWLIIPIFSLYSFLFTSFIYLSTIIVVLLFILFIILSIFRLAFAIQIRSILRHILFLLAFFLCGFICICGLINNPSIYQTVVFSSTTLLILTNPNVFLRKKQIFFNIFLPILSFFLAWYYSSILAYPFVIAFLVLILWALLNNRWKGINYTFRFFLKNNRSFLLFVMLIGGLTSIANTLSAMRNSSTDMQVIFNWKQVSVDQKKTGAIYDILVDDVFGRLYFSDKDLMRIGWIDLATNKIFISDTEYKGPERMAIVYDKGELVTYQKYGISSSYGAHSGEKPEGVIILDKDTLKLIKRVGGDPPTNMKYDAKWDRMVYVNELFSRMVVLDMKTQTAKEIDSPGSFRFAYGIYPISGTNYYFVSYYGVVPWISRIELDENGKPVKAEKVFIGIGQMDIAIDVKNNRVFVTKPMNGKIDVISIEPFKKIGTLPAPIWVRAIAYLPEDDIIFGSSFFNGQVWMVNVKTSKVLAKFQLTGGKCRTAGYSSRFKTVYVANESKIYAFPKDIYGKYLYQ